MITCFGIYFLLHPTLGSKDLSLILTSCEKKYPNTLSKTHTFLPIRWPHVNNHTIYVCMERLSPRPVGAMLKSVQSSSPNFHPPHFQEGEVLLGPTRLAHNCANYQLVKPPTVPVLEMYEFLSSRNAYLGNQERRREDVRFSIFTVINSLLYHY